MPANRRTIEFLLTAKDKTSRAFRSVTGKMDQLRKSAVGLASSLGIAFGGAGIIAGIRSTATEIDRLAKVARKLGTTTDEVIKLGQAAQLTGVPLRTFEIGLQRMRRRISEAATGTGEAVKAIEELGLSAEKLNLLNVEDQFKTLADAFGDVDNSADRLRLGFKLFDSEAAAMINTLALGRKALDEIGEETERFGKTVGDSDKKIEKFNDDLVKFEARMNGLSTMLAVHMIPNWTDWIDVVVGFFSDAPLGIALVSKELQDVSHAIVSIKNEMERLESFRSTHEWGLGNTDALDAQLDDLRKSLLDHEKLKEDIINRSGVERAQKNKEREQRAHNRAMSAAQKENEDNLKKHIAENKKALENSVSALEDYGQERQRIQQEINKAVLDIKGEEEPPATKLEVLDELTAAYNAFLNEDFTGALEHIREGLNLLASYKDVGKSSEHTIKDLADAFKDLSIDALAAQGADLKGEVDDAAAAHEALKKEIEKKPIKAPVEAADGSGTAVIDGVQVQVDEESASNPIVVPVSIGLARGVNMPVPMTRDNMPGQDVENESTKRGFRI